jgi:hypothetical protein
VRAARKQYEESSLEVVRLAGELNDGLCEPPDGSEVIRQAHKRESLARDEYMRTLRLYSELILLGKVPEEPKS